MSTLEEGDSETREDLTKYLERRGFAVYATETIEDLRLAVRLDREEVEEEEDCCDSPVFVVEDHPSDSRFEAPANQEDRR